MNGTGIRAHLRRLLANLDNVAVISRVALPLLDFALTEPDVRRYRIRLFQASNPD